jgi:hypothetical protein
LEAIGQFARNAGNLAIRFFICCVPVHSSIRGMPGTIGWNPCALMLFLVWECNLEGSCDVPTPSIARGPTLLNGTLIASNYRKMASGVLTMRINFDTPQKKVPNFPSLSILNEITLISVDQYRKNVRFFFTQSLFSQSGHRTT